MDRCPRKLLRQGQATDLSMDPFESILSSHRISTRFFRSGSTIYECLKKLTWAKFCHTICMRCSDPTPDKLLFLIDILSWLLRVFSPTVVGTNCRSAGCLDDHQPARRPYSHEDDGHDQHQWAPAPYSRADADHGQHRSAQIPCSRVADDAVLHRSRVAPFFLFASLHSRRQHSRNLFKADQK